MSALPPKQKFTFQETEIHITKSPGYVLYGFMVPKIEFKLIKDCRASLAYFVKRLPQAENVSQSLKIKRNKCTKNTNATQMLR